MWSLTSLALTECAGMLADSEDGTDSGLTLGLQSDASQKVTDWKGWEAILPHPFPFSPRILIVDGGMDRFLIGGWSQHRQLSTNTVNGEFVLI